MWRFCYKIFLQCCLLTGLFAIIGPIICDKPLHLAGFEVFHSVKKAKMKKNVKYLILGDSVTRQIYNNYSYNDSIYSLACNQVITMAGQYFLLHDFIKANPNKPHCVILMMHPYSFANDLDQNGYQYFLKPLDTPNHRALKNRHLSDRIHQICLAKWSQFPPIKYGNFSPSSSIKTNSKGISQISKEYLDSIICYCNSNHIELRLCSTPIKESEFNSVLEVFDPQVDSMLTSYKSSIRLYPNEYFVDNLHFREEFIPKDFLQLQSSIL